MKAILQRVSKASVLIDNENIAEIKQGILILLGVCTEDNDICAKVLAQKTANLRIFEDDNKKINLSCLDIDGEILVVSNFTLYSDCKKGRRPSFVSAARPEIAKPLFDKYCNYLEEAGIKTVKKGVFGADMKVEIFNDGPVTIILDTKEL